MTMDELHIGIVTVDPEKTFPCSERLLRRLLFMAGYEREKARRDILQCLEELKATSPDKAERLEANIQMLKEIE